MTEPIRDRIEPVDIQYEMQRSYIDYAMSVIVGRALPDVRDGLKPVHRKILYGMYDGGYRPDRGYVKCARVVGDVMGNYHPHGDTPIYDTLVRMAQPWSLRYPLVDGQGNFGSPGNDPAAAMRYCISAETLVRLADGSEVAVVDVAPEAAPNSDTAVDLKVIGLTGDPVRATALLHSGSHPTLTVRTQYGQLTGTGNHPVLCAVRVGNDIVPRWKLISELRPGDLLARLDGDAESVAKSVPAGTFFDVPERRLPTDVDVALHSWARVEAVVDAGVQPVYSLRVDTDDHAFITNGFISHNTESRLAPLAMEMLRDIDKDTVDFSPNYDGKSQEPDILPSRIPNLLVNGSEGIAVGMATKIPPHNLREVAAGVEWALDNPDATDEELLEALIERVKGPDFPTHGVIVGLDGIQDAYRTGRGSIRMRAVVTVEEDSKGRTTLVATELPYQVNPDNLAENIAAMVKEGRIGGIADISDESSDRIGRRLVISLRRDAVAKVVLNNLYKHTQLQTTFGANMLAIVDGVPRTLRLDEIIRHYVAHQIDVVFRRTKYLLRKAEERAHILRGYAKALSQLDAVIALIRASESAETARGGLMNLLEIDELQATAILDMQLRRLAALERQRIIDELAEIEKEIAELQAILDSQPRQRQLVRDELREIVERHGDDRYTRLIPAEGDVSVEDLIAEEEVVVTITRTGYAKRTKSDLYRSQRRGGKGVQGANLKVDDIVAHFFVGSTHNWILFLTNKGRVYRAKAFELPEANRNARGQHVANILAFQPDEQIAQVIQIKDYSVAPYLALSTRRGLVKKSRLTDFDSPRQGGLIAINLREDDELVGAALISADDDLLLVSKAAQSIRFKADDDTLRPQGRATSGVIGMRFASDDELLAMEVVREGLDVLVATERGYAKRTGIEFYPTQNRGGRGVLTADPKSRKGVLVGALAVRLEDDLYAITSNGGVIRTSVRGVRRTKERATMGVKLMNLPDDVTIVALARNADEPEE
ncbi:MAG: DNA gyrase subunit A [Geodermatophilaceae bacterium]|nr:DNA gyrase subunit A [Geodermatophilaceae bacterium]